MGASNKMVRLAPAMAAMLLVSAFLVSTVVEGRDKFDDDVPAPEEPDFPDDYDDGFGEGGLADDEPVEKGCPSAKCVTNKQNQCKVGCLCVSFIPFTAPGVCIGICCQSNRTPPSPSPSPSPWPFPWWPRPSPSPPKKSPPPPPPKDGGKDGGKDGDKDGGSPFSPPKTSPLPIWPPADIPSPMIPPFLSVAITKDTVGPVAADEDHA